MVRPSDPDVTELLRQWSAGSQEALDALVPQVQKELRQLARTYLSGENPGHTLQPTALVNEAFLKLVRERVSWQNRAHFFGIAATHMRRILSDYARRRLAVKRDAGARVDLDDAMIVASWGSPDAVLDLDMALDRIAEINPRCARLAELHYFGGLSVDEAAVVVNLSPATVKRDLKLARELLAKSLERSPRQR